MKPWKIEIDGKIRDSDDCAFHPVGVSHGVFYESCTYRYDPNGCNKATCPIKKEATDGD